ncbi:hypothetical protein TL16_g08663 [Triparma laevis f. inornata]|uniref:Uncharacterized protein n=1 Tax=Triparma laevis f. inornata TaxID=1714386 RepID=A0A9W7B407_9STRA|nr:hypothetical protein TL16_g08663 [Triparma laevis f. inornata]
MGVLLRRQDLPFKLLDSLTMKFVAALVCLLATANAYTAPLMATKVLKSKTKPVAKKVAKAGKAAPRSSGGSSVGAAAWANAGPSTALPFATSPATLDGSMLGDVGFDPFGFSTTPVGPWFLGNTIPSQGVIGDLEWYREAEIIHGRIAQIAVLGFLGPEVSVSEERTSTTRSEATIREFDIYSRFTPRFTITTTNTARYARRSSQLFGTLPGNDWTGADAYSNTNPLEAFSQVPGLALTQIFLFMSFLEIRRLNIIKEEGRNFQPGGEKEGRRTMRSEAFTRSHY